MPRGPFDVAHVTRQRAELPELRIVRPAEVTGGVPGGVVRARFGSRGEFFARRRFRLQDLVAALHVRIDSFTRDEEMLDLARSFEDPVDAHVAQDSLDRICLLTPFAQRLRSFESAAATDLYEMIGALPCRLGVE